MKAVDHCIWCGGAMNAPHVDCFRWAETFATRHGRYPCAMLPTDDPEMVATAKLRMTDPAAAVHAARALATPKRILLRGGKHDGMVIVLPSMDGAWQVIAPPPLPTAAIPPERYRKSGCIDRETGLPIYDFEGYSR